jgi:cytochrome bd-type quinol oxidase subunit 2
MSKIRKGSNITTRLRVQKQDLSLPKLFDMIALISFLGAVVFTGATYLINEKLDMLREPAAEYYFWRTWIRVAYSIMMYCLITFGTSYGMGRFMKDQEHDQVKQFRLWFGTQVVVAVLLILTLGAFF